MKELRVKEIAFGLAGDKGNISNVFLIPYRGSDFELLKDKLPADRVREIYSPLIDGHVERYELHGIEALNFVMQDALQGGVSSSLNVDPHGKSRAQLLLGTKILVKDDYEPPPTRNGQKEWIR